MGKKLATPKPQKLQPKNGTFSQWLEQQPQGKRGRLILLRDRLVRLFHDPHRGDIRWQYAVGKTVLGLFPADDQRRGQGFMEMLGDLVEPGRDRSDKSIITALYNWRSMAVRCSPEEIRAFAAKVRTQALTAQHVVYLVSVSPENNTISRGEFLQNSITHDWSANQLRREIQADRKHLTSFGGRH